MAGPPQGSWLDNPWVFGGHSTTSLVCRPADVKASLSPSDLAAHQVSCWLVTPVTGLPKPPHPSDRTRGVCLAIPGQVIEIVDDLNRLAKVDVAGVRRNVNVGLLDGEDGGVGPGDWVLIHVGFAISKVDEEEARATRDLLVRMGADYEQELEELKASVIE